MKLYEIVTVLSDIRYDRAIGIKEGDWFNYRVDGPDNIKLLRGKKPFARLPKKVALEMTMKSDNDTYAQVECVVSGWEPAVRIIGYGLKRVPMPCDE